VASALIKVFNLIREGSTIELSQPSLRQNITWPMHLGPSASHITSLKSCSTILHSILDHLLEQKPIEVNWIRAKAELFLVEDDCEESLKWFVNLITITSEYFTTFNDRSRDEETAIQKMVIASSKLNCHTQAAVLIQMSSEPNYNLAFKYLSERTCHDACEQLYECIWDLNLLEYLVSLHTRRGEVDRKLKAIHLIGQLELNSNNSPEILKEAAGVRKAKLFRLLTKKYLD
jgi:integrator complex subunit 8